MLLFYFIEYILKICPYYDILEEIFSEKSNIHIPYTHDTENVQTETEEYEIIYEEMIPMKMKIRIVIRQ